MSKKNKTKTATILIRLNGDETTAALLADGYSPDRIAIARAWRSPADTYDAYEGARIALARLYDREPFPEAEPKAKPKPLKRSGQRRFKVGDLARAKMPMCSLGMYEKGDLVKITEVRPTGYYVQVVNGPRADFFRLTGKFAFVTESELGPVEAEEKKPEPSDLSQPSFQVGDIVRTGGDVFADNCRNCAGRVRKVWRTGAGRFDYTVQVFSDKLGTPGTYATQFCHEQPGAPAPMKLLWREEKECRN